MRLLLVCISWILLLGFLQAHSRNGRYHRTREEMIRRAKAGHKHVDINEITKMISNKKDADAVERTSKLMEQIREKQARIQPELCAEAKKVSEEMYKLMEGRNGVLPSMYEINEEIADHLFEGDIVLSPNVIADVERTLNGGSKLSKRAVVYTTFIKWPKNDTIYFSHGEGFDASNRTWIRKKMAEITENTCLNYMEGTGKYQLTFERWNGCYSGTGIDTGPKQSISIDYWCENSIQHEVAHSIGLGHTQKRNDRDDFVTIDFTAGDADGYKTLYEDYSINVSYNYESSLHYEAYVGSTNGKPTIIPKDADFMTTMGSRHELQFSDYKQINLLYKCGEQCPPIKCENGGYQHPRKCNECACTLFHTGARCEKHKVFNFTMYDLPKGYPAMKESVIRSGPYNATLFAQYGETIDYSLYKKIDPVVIQAPPGRKIRVILNEVNILTGQPQRTDLQCLRKCYYVAFEVVDNTQGDLTMGGKKFCCKSREGHSFVSKSNILGFKGYAAPGWDYDFDFSVELV